jgi:hypothetical protein
VELKQGISSVSLVGRANFCLKVAIGKLSYPKFTWFMYQGHENKKGDIKHGFTLS